LAQDRALARGALSGCVAPRARLSLIARSLPKYVGIWWLPLSVPKESDMTRTIGRNTAPSTKGKLIHWALAYDIAV
jgi:hypothetical protein